MKPWCRCFQPVFQLDDYIVAQRLIVVQRENWNQLFLQVRFGIRVPVHNKSLNQSNGFMYHGCHSQSTFVMHLSAHGVKKLSECKHNNQHLPLIYCKMLIIEYNQSYESQNCEDHPSLVEKIF